MEIPHENERIERGDVTIMVTLPTGEAVDLLTEAGAPIMGSLSPTLEAPNARTDQ